MSAKRYIIHYDARGEEEHPKGDFVHWPDYQALASQFAEIDTHRRKVIAENGRLLNSFIEKDRQLAEARAALHIATEDKLSLLDQLQSAEAERDRLAARLSENNRWPDPLQSPQAEAIRNGKIDMTEIVSLFDKMERELEQLRFVAADNARLEAENDNGGDLTRCVFCGRPILGRIVMDVNFTPSCEECAGPSLIQGGRHD
jgi:hypothetical protein